MLYFDINIYITQFWIELRNQTKYAFIVFQSVFLNEDGIDMNGLFWKLTLRNRPNIDNTGERNCKLLFDTSNTYYYNSMMAIISTVRSKI